jgi:hypothetical protein
MCSDLNIQFKCGLRVSINQTMETALIAGEDLPGFNSRNSHTAEPAGVYQTTLYIIAVKVRMLPSVDDDDDSY